jgi:hypothetical protein
MKRLIILVFMFIFLLGCAATKEYKVGYEITLPKKPKVVVVDNGKVDKKKYPNTKFVKKPEIIPDKGKASWDFEDIDKISESLTEWPAYGDTVEDIINKHNTTVKKQVDGGGMSWWPFW